MLQNCQNRKYTLAVEGYCPGCSDSQSRDTFGHSCNDGSMVVSSQQNVLKQRNHNTGTTLGNQMFKK